RGATDGSADYRALLLVGLQRGATADRDGGECERGDGTRAAYEMHGYDLRFLSGRTRLRRLSACVPKRPQPRNILEKSDDFSGRQLADALRSRLLGQARHCHDL